MTYGEGGNFSVKMDGPFGNSDMAVRLVEINAPLANWKGAASPYSQVVTVDGLSINSKVDIQLSTSQLEQFHDQIIAFTVENYDGVTTLYAIGDKPKTDCIFQATITEVIKGEKLSIKGSTASTTQANADYSETDPGKASFILNKPDAAILKAQQTADSGKQIAEAAMPKDGGDFSGPVTVQTPTVNNNPATKVYVDEKHKVFTVNLTAAGWTGDGPYTQTVAVDGIMSTDMPHYGCVYAEDQETRVIQKEAFTCVDDLNTKDGSVTFTCFEDKPDVNITIQMEVNR